MKKLILNLSLILSCFTTFAQIPTNGLVAYYPFNGNANDASGNNNNGVNYGTTLAADRFGNLNSAYSFNGVSNYIEIPFSNSYNFPSTGSFTFSFWVKGGLFDICQAMIVKSPLNGKWDYGFYLTGNSCLTSSSKSNVIMMGYDNNHLIGSKNSIDANWHHVVGMYMNNSWSLYFDNAFQDSYANKSITTSLGKLVFGKKGDANGDYFKGNLDDIRIYDRVLNQSEITYLFTENTCFQTISVSDTLRISKITGLNELPSNFGNIKIYPNPTNNILNISVSNPSSNYKINILNNLSQSINSFIMSDSSYQINLANLPRAMYYIQITDLNSNVLETKKLILE